MMLVRVLVATLAIFLSTAWSIPSYATLIDRGGGLIYDTDLNITWLRDGNYAQTSGFDPHGLMTWSEAMAWAENLTFGGFDDWRLPTSLNEDGSGPCWSGPCTGSEMGHLFYIELGGLFGSSIFATGNSNLGLFTNIQPFYWSSTEFDPIRDVGVGGIAWDLDFLHGFQGVGVGPLFAWGVRDGDVLPEPNTLVLFTSALLLIGLASLGFSRRKRAA